ncbi:hypothetical protein [Deinococcus taeanensis]|uniref:hypothetical protein n=1 Tax=Deinococcus taeanensis TaxID=2737050 RepID=UPI0032E80081
MRVEADFRYFPLNGLPALTRPGAAGHQVRGREELRIISGPEDTRPEHLERRQYRQLKARRSLALREFRHQGPRAVCAARA